MKEKDEEIEVLPERDVEVEVAQGIGEPIGPVVVGVGIDVKLMINVEVLVEAVISIKVRLKNKRGERRGGPDTCPLPKEARGEGCHESQREGISRKGRHTQRSWGPRTNTALPIKRWRPKPGAERTRCKWLVLSGSRM